MPVPVSSEDFLRLAEESGVVSRSVLDAAVHKIAKDGELAVDAQTLANSLVSNETLTRWQAEKLLEGRHQGLVLGNYRLKSLLGRGSMGAVYLAEHSLMRREVALKVMSFDHEEEPSYLDRFLREAQAVAALDHPNIVRAFDVGSEQHGDRDIYYLAMQYIPGVDLAELVKRDGRLELTRAVDFTRQVSAGLGHAHQEGLVHRDIKPGNLLVEKNDTVRILDLGLAVFLTRDQPGEASLTRENGDRLLGTADYMAPEQALNSHEVDHRADIYSLGCTLYFMITGYPPFRTGTVPQRLLAHQTQTPVSPKSHRPEVPDDLCAIIDRMLKKNPEDRFRSCRDLIEALSNWLQKHDPAATVQPVNPPTAIASLADTTPGEIDWSSELEKAAQSAAADPKPVPASAVPAPPVPAPPVPAPEVASSPSQNETPGFGFRTLGFLAVAILVAALTTWAVVQFSVGNRQQTAAPAGGDTESTTPANGGSESKTTDSQDAVTSTGSEPDPSPGQQWAEFSSTLRNDRDLLFYLPFEAPAEEGQLTSQAKAGPYPDITVKLVGDPQWVEGRFPEKAAVRLGGPETSDYLALNASDSAAFNFESSFSVMVWFRVLKFSERYQAIISKGDFGFRIARYRETSGLAFAINQYHSENDPVQLPLMSEVHAESYRVDDENWHLVVGVLNAESQNVTLDLFIDGELRGSVPTPAPQAPYNAPVLIGANSFFLEQRPSQISGVEVTEQPRQFEGDIDEVAVFQRALNADEIAEMYDLGRPR